jgi:DNA-binding NtrC family response regulator
MSEVARRLQIGRSTLYRKLEGLGLGASATDSGHLTDVAGE